MVRQHPLLSSARRSFNYHTHAPSRIAICCSRNLQTPQKNIPTAHSTIQFLHRLGRSACALTLFPCIILARVLFQVNFERRWLYFQFALPLLRIHHHRISTLEIGAFSYQLVTKRLHVQPLDTRHPFCASRTAASRSWTLSQATSTRLATEPTLKVKRPSNVVIFP